MSDPAIKLFGKTISLPSPIDDGGGGCGGADDHKSSQNKEATTEMRDQSARSEENTEPMTVSSDAADTNKAVPSSGDGGDDDNDQETTAENEQSPAESEEKPALKKPDKIIPCPRCSSMDTKFCYYNNYNVNQPRHFCKNCQRYWTAGGTMRNVPVGAGRRKNKNLSPHCRHLTVPEQIHHYQPSNPNGTVLSFGSNAPPLCDSMASVLNLADKTDIRNGFIQREEQSTGSSVTASSSADEDPQPHQAFAPPQFPYINGSPWPYPWNPIPFYPATAAYWGCIPWLSPLPTPSLSPNSASSSVCGPTLGKHPRDGDAPPFRTNRNGSGKGDEKCLWFPKTLRIHDPGEAAKSSLWATMGFSNDTTSDTSSSRRGLFLPFHTKDELSNQRTEAASRLLHANPAALSRSFNFQESL